MIISIKKKTIIERGLDLALVSIDGKFVIKGSLGGVLRVHIQQILLTEAWRQVQPLPIILSIVSKVNIILICSLSTRME